MAMTLQQCVEQRAALYLQRGFTEQQAVDMAFHDCAPGLGQAPADPTAAPAAQAPANPLASILSPSVAALYQDVSAPVAEASQIVSPWLWILSVVGFVMGTLNSARIKKMYGSWKRAHQVHGT
jgi:hypothetical protein